MPTITIAKELSTVNDLIAVPRGTYEEFLMWQKKIKSVRTFVPTKSELGALAFARQEFKDGNYVLWEQLKHKLANKRSRASNTY